MANGKHIDLKYFEIPIAGLSEGKHEYEFTCDSAFFEHFDAPDLNGSTCSVRVVLERGSRLIEVETEFSGKLETSCDRCGNQGVYPYSGKEIHTFKFGEGDSDDPEVSFLSQETHHIKLAHLFYEYIATSLPLRYTCKDADPAQTCDPEVIEKIEALNPGDQTVEESEIDPRWAELKKLSKS